MADRAFHEQLAGHLDAGTRPGLKAGAVGGKWTTVAFAKAVNFEDRTVRNWRSGATLPDVDALGFINSALFGEDASLQLARRALQQAWDVAFQRQERRQTRPNQPSTHAKISEIRHPVNNQKTNSINDDIDPASSDTVFHAMFDKYWHCGAGRNKIENSAQSWTTANLAISLRQQNCMVSHAIIETWLNKSKIPIWPEISAIADVFFPAYEHDAQQHAERQSFIDAWTKVQRHQNAFRHSDMDEPRPEELNEWSRKNPVPFSGLAELELFSPQPDNQDGYRLKARLLIGSREDETTEKPVLISLTEAFITVRPSKKVTINGSLVGTREKHPNLAPVPGGLKITGPKSSNHNTKTLKKSVLSGDVFEDADLAIIRIEDNSEDAQVSVSLSVSRRGFNVDALDENGEISKDAYTSEAKKAILNLLICRELDADDQGRVVLQRATLKRKKNQ